LGPDPGAERDLLAHAAEEAGRIALRHFRTDLAVREKPGDAGPVTEADLAVDRFLRKSLTAARPGHGWLSEETEDSPARLAAPRVFIVDPIDGTRAFIDGKEGWGISIGLAEAGRIVAAAVALPARGELYLAAEGLGATLDGRPIRASRRTALEGAETLAPRPHLEARHWPGGVPQVRRSFRSSLAWRLCLAACGGVDAMLTLRDAWEWDIAAGALIAAEAGAAVTDREGAPLRFNAPRPLAPGVIVAPPALHAEFLRCRRPVADDARAARPD
jgi:myo-inositol-1(or 4)-monophosphatase